MALPRMRPSFVIDVRCPADDVMKALRDHIDDNPQRVEATFSQYNGVLRSQGEKQRFWSPCLDLTIEDMRRKPRTGISDEESDEDAPGGLAPSKVWGTFSPRPEIWTGFIFAIGTSIVASLIAGFFGIAQIMSGEAPTAFVVPIVAFVFAAGVYASALIGQGLSLDEMYRIRNYVDNSLRVAEERARKRPPLRADASSQL